MAGKRYVRGTLTTAQKGMFVAGTSFSDVSGRVKSPFREMMIGETVQSGRHAKGLQTEQYWDRRRMELPKNYSGTGAYNVNKRNRRDIWGTSRISNKVVTRTLWNVPNDASTITLKNINQLYQHFVIVAHQIPIASEHWRMVLARRALAVFKESLTLKRFNSDGSRKWKLNTKWTRQKRKWKGTWPGAGKLMQETNNLFNSLHVVDSALTSSVVASARYAGIHNCPEPGMTYGNGFGGRYSPPKPVTQRQFMGHSTKIDEFIAIYERRYLFDTIFRAPV